MGKAAKSCSVIGGVEGPTSVFLIGGKEKNIFKRIQKKFLNERYKRKRKRAEKQIIPGAHTVKETIQYMKERYGAVEADASYPYYGARKSNLRYSVILREKPELLGEEKIILPPGDFSDSQAVREWQRQIEEQSKERLRKMDEIPAEVILTDYHLFLIDKGEQGRLEIETDTAYPCIFASYSGEKEVMEPILRDIHRYFGVSEEDIETESDRYMVLLSVLSS